MGEEYLEYLEYMKDFWNKTVVWLKPESWKSYLFESAWWGSASLLSQPGGWDAGKNQGQVIFMILLGLVF